MEPTSQTGPHMPPSDEPQPRPQLPVDARTVREITAGYQTCMLISHQSTRWFEQLQPDLEFTAWARLGEHPARWRVWVDVKVTGMCAHDWIGEVRDCAAGHRPEVIDRRRTGWRRIIEHALHANADIKPPVDVEMAKANAGWSVVDFVCVDAGKERVPRAKRPRRYRNRIEEDLAEENRRFEQLRLAAIEAGQAPPESEDLLRFRAKSAAYNRKLTRALEVGDDPKVLTVDDAEIEAELERMRRRHRA